MKTWDAFYDSAAVDLPSCPLAMLDSALRRAAIAFCEQSLAWRYAHPDIPVVQGTAQYAFAPPGGALVHAITYAKFGDSEIEWRRREYLWGDWRSKTGTPEVVLGGATGLTLVPKPDVAGSLSLVVALKPSNVATGVDDDIFDQFRECIVHGALAMLMLSPKKPYTDGSLGLVHQQQFASSTCAAGARVAQDYSRAPLQTVVSRRREA